VNTASIAAVPAHLEREEPGWIASALFALAIHVLLLAVLFFGVRWQSRAPDAVSVELWLPPTAPVERVEPRPEPPVARPEPPPVPKSEPRPEPKPDIAVQEKPKPKPKPKPVPEIKNEPKPVAKPVPKPEAKPRDEEMQKRLREELQREQASVKADLERRALQDLLARDANAAQQAALAKGRAGYADKIKIKIKGNINLPQEIKGNPEAVFEVVQLPTGEVLSAKLKRSSGHRAYDEAVERAILKSSPLPRPDRTELFERTLVLTFRPLD